MICTFSQFLLGLQGYGILEHGEFRLVQNGISQVSFCVQLLEVREGHCAASVIVSQF